MSCTFDRVTVATLPQVELNTLRRQLLQCHVHSSSAQRQPARRDQPANSPSFPVRLAVRHRNTLCIIKDTFPKRLLAHYSATTVACLATQNVHFTSKECAHPGSLCWKYKQGEKNGLNWRQLKFLTVVILSEKTTCSVGDGLFSETSN